MADEHHITCEEALARLVELVDGELPEPERNEVERHLRTCRSCFSRMEFERRLKQRLSALPTDDVPATLRRRIHDLLDGF